MLLVQEGLYMLVNYLSMNTRCKRSKNMSKSSKELVEDKTKNKVYCEILFKLNTKEVFLFDFVKEFDKARPTLLKQIHDLEEEGYIQRRVEGRKQLFSVNWIKINQEFLIYLKNRRPDLKVMSGMENNKYLITYFQEMLKGYNKKGSYITLEGLYFNTTGSLFDSLLKPASNNKEEEKFKEFMEKLQEFLYTDCIFEDTMQDIAEEMDKK